MSVRSQPLGSLELMRRFLRDRGDEGLARELARRAVASLPPVTGLAVLDVGSGPGYYATAMQDLGATVTAIELSRDELEPPDGSAPPSGTAIADARSMPFVAEVFDAVVCSNMLEHTPDPLDVIDEIGRVLRPAGWVYLSWTNWLSPWGGHAIAPLHYLGPERGLNAYRRLFGEPTGKNLPFAGVWPLAIRDVLGHLDGHETLRVERVEPRYYPWARPIMRVPGLREVIAWNCVVWLRHRAHDES